jgi:hypothetical protein
MSFWLTSGQRRVFVVSTLAGVVLAGSVGVALAWQPLAVKADPLVRMPGTQPPPEGSVSLESPNRCLNCHAGYNPSVEPGFNWKGSMMAQAARDFLYFSCLTVAAQDSIWALGNPNATDICIRCHSPGGWMGGRSDPTNFSALSGADFDGVQCDFCHRMYDPFFESTQAGTREGAGIAGYWDETNLSSTPSGPAALLTHDEDASQAGTVKQFNGDPFFSGNDPASEAWDEAGSGQFFVSSEAAKRAPFADADARHQMLYSRFHKSKFFCATCHDVSNPILANLGADANQPLPTELNPAYSYFHVERTFSEFMLSDYGQDGGSAGIGPFDPGVFQTSTANNFIGKCQDCHMRDVIGVAANKNGAVLRPDDSIEHPESGQPLHDLTGGNAWVSWVLASTDPASSNYDSVNEELLEQGPAVLTLDLSQGQGIDGPALLAGSDRAKQQLELAAAINHLTYNAVTGALSFQVQNQTGHKLISGFPEGRRMFLSIKVYAAGSLIQEINPYDAAAGTLKGLDYEYVPGQGLPAPQALAPHESYRDELVYETHPTSTLTGEEHSFHFALATGRYKDNRIPPKGFRSSEAAARQSTSVWHGLDSPDLYTAAEYAGGYDDVSLDIATGADAVEVNLYYQTTSREYIEFLRDEIRGEGNLTLTDPGAGGDPAYLIQTDPFFGQLKAWGDTIWSLWTHNMNVAGAAPYLMAQATVGSTGGGCTPPTPTLLTAAPSHQQVTVSWSNEHGADGDVIGYNVYYDQAAKGQWIAQVGRTTTYDDTDLTNGQQYCYKVTSSYADCESEFSNILCATPTNQGLSAGVSQLQTGVIEGKGKNQQFVQTTVFSRGDEVLIRAMVVDSGGQPVEGAIVDLGITGPESASVTSGASDATGIAEASWQTQAPNRKGVGGTAPGDYTAAVNGVTADGYVWDGIVTSTVLALQ